MKDKILEYLKELEINDLFVSENKYVFELGIIEGITNFTVGYIEKDSNIETMEDFRNSIMSLLHKKVFESKFIEYKRNEKIKELGL